MHLCMSCLFLIKAKIYIVDQVHQHEDVVDTGLTKELKKKVRVRYSMVYVLGLGMFIMT